MLVYVDEKLKKNLNEIEKIPPNAYNLYDLRASEWGFYSCIMLRIN
jgi:hypothetical protein